MNCGMKAFGIKRKTSRYCTSVVGAGLAPALIQGDRKGRPYTFQ